MTPTIGRVFRRPSIAQVADLASAAGKGSGNRVFSFIHDWSAASRGER